MLVVLALAAVAVGCSKGARRTSTAVPSTSAPSSPPTTTAPTTGVTPSTTVVPSLAAAAWTTYQHDPGRRGVDESSPPMTRLTPLWSARLDADSYGQPLVVGNRVIVATEANTVMSVDAATGRAQWRLKLGQPLRLSELPCGNIDPSGITSTPVADTATGTVFVVTFAVPGHHDLVALDLDTGAVRWRRSIDPPGSDPLVEQQRGALALAGGVVYVPFGGLYGDCGAYHGYVVGAPVAGPGSTTPLSVYQVPARKGGGIWAPPGPVVTPDGQLLVATGNTFSSASGSAFSSASTFDGGNAVVRLSPDLRALDVFAPSDWASLNQTDGDLGSTSPTVLDHGFVFQVGKEGFGYLLRLDHLGGVGGQAYAGAVGRAALGATAYAPPYVYVPCRDGLRSLRIDDGPPPRFSSVWRGPAFDPGPPIVAGGTVWVVDLGTGELVGLDPANGSERNRTHVGRATHFAAPSAGAGRVYVAAGGALNAFRGS